LNKILGGDSNDAILANSKLSEDYLLSVSTSVTVTFAQEGSNATAAFLIGVSFVTLILIIKWIFHSMRPEKSLLLARFVLTIFRKEEIALSPKAGGE